MNEYDESQHKAQEFNAHELFNKIKNDPEFKKEERFLELTEDILSVVGDRLTKLEHAVCVVAQAVSKMASYLEPDGDKQYYTAKFYRTIQQRMNLLIANLTPEPKKSAIITPKPEPSEPDPKNGYGYSEEAYPNDTEVDARD